MRLSKPSLKVEPSVYAERGEIGQDVVLTHGGTHGGHEFGLNETLLLPLSFGAMYLGETFSSYLSIHNHSPFDVASVSIKAELQTSSSRFALLDVPATQVPSFPASASNDFVIKHKVKEEGIHILVCSVNYIRHDAEKKYFRKFFKFQVDNPLSVRSRAIAVGPALFVESQIQNVTKEPLFLDTVALLPELPSRMIVDNLSADLSVAPREQFPNSAVSRERSKNSLSSSSSPSSSPPLPSAAAAQTSSAAAVAKKDDDRVLISLKPAHSIHLLHKITIRDMPDAAAASVSGIQRKEFETVGTLHIAWKSALGETGRLQTPRIKQKMPTRRGIELSLSLFPESIELEQPFVVDCHLVNQSSHTASLILLLIQQKMSGIMITGVSGRNIGTLPPHASKVISLTLFPLHPGVQTITGIRIIDTTSDKRYDFDRIASVLVK
jgi:trafficking protein particle complex subunit 13